MRYIFAVLLLSSTAFADPQCSVSNLNNVPLDHDVQSLMTMAAGKHYQTTLDKVTVVYCNDTVNLIDWYTIGMPYFRPLASRPPAVIIYSPSSPPTRMTLKKGSKKAYIYTTSISFRVTLNADGNAVKYRMLDARGHVIPTTIAPQAKRRLLSRPQPVLQTVTGDIGCANYFAAKSQCELDKWNSLSDTDKIKVALRFGSAITLPLDCILGVAATGSAAGCPILTTIIKWWISQLPDLCPQFDDSSCTTQFCHYPGWCARDSRGLATCFAFGGGLQEDIKAETSTADCKCRCDNCIEGCNGIAICQINDTGTDPPGVDLTLWYCVGQPGGSLRVDSTLISACDPQGCQSNVSLDGDFASPPNGNPLYFPQIGGCTRNVSWLYDAVLYDSLVSEPSDHFAFTFNCTTQ